MPRQFRGATSQKPSTMRIRDAERQQRGLSAGIRKVRAKWRLRKFRAKATVMKSSVYNQLYALTPQRCDEYLALVGKEFDCLRDSEIEEVTSLWKTSHIHTFRNRANDSVETQSNHFPSMSTQNEDDQTHTRTRECTERSELTTLIVNPPFETSTAFEVMKSLMLAL